MGRAGGTRIHLERPAFSIDLMGFDSPLGRSARKLAELTPVPLSPTRGTAPAAPAATAPRGVDRGLGAAAGSFIAGPNPSFDTRFDSEGRLRAGLLLQL